MRRGGREGMSADAIVPSFKFHHRRPFSSPIHLEGSSVRIFQYLNEKAKAHFFSSFNFPTHISNSNHAKMPNMPNAKTNNFEEFVKE
jgi:hypothetical protein